MQKRVTAVLFDVDGTLVDSNDAHCSAWVKAFWEYGLTVDPIAGRRSIGMGGDKLMPAVSGIEQDSALGQLIAKRRAQIFKREQLPHLKPFNGAKTWWRQSRTAAVPQWPRAQRKRKSVVGDTPYDIQAATRAGMKTIAFRSGGWRDADLDGAIAIYDGPWDLLARIDESPLRRS